MWGVRFFSQEINTMMAFSIKLNNYQAGANSVLWYIHIILRILTNMVHLCEQQLGSCLEPFQRAVQTLLPFPSIARTRAASRAENKPDQPCVTQEYLSTVLPSASRNTAEVSFILLSTEPTCIQQISCLEKAFVLAGKCKQSLETLKLSVRSCISNNKLL